ncbi:hypothetical protein FHS85_004797 [Rhodoligotrophos appendicifer]|uniref:hypothetical protein n=1 Tax=Rhodoligotrophos appendicifer TaxID=987056 RepID=UPI001184B53F|nr:hypothetical protein [Rhodoligotrophos appendicifer]
MASPPSDRVRRYRKRQREGRIVLMIEVDEANLVDVLTHSGVLSPLMADDHESIREAYQAFTATLKVVRDDEM